MLPDRGRQSSLRQNAPHAAAHSYHYTLYCAMFVGVVIGGAGGASRHAIRSGSGCALLFLRCSSTNVTGSSVDDSDDDADTAVGEYEAGKANRMLTLAAEHERAASRRVTKKSATMCCCCYGCGGTQQWTRARVQRLEDGAKRGDVRNDHGRRECVDSEVSRDTRN